MKSLLTFRALILSGLICFAPLPAAFAQYGEEEEKKLTTMEKHWTKLEDAYRDARRSMRGADESDKAEILGLLTTMRDEAVCVKGLVPVKLQSLEGKAREEALAAFQKDMTAFITDIEKAIAAVEKTEFDTANDVLRNLRSHKSSGHEKYKYDY
ncbi:MAG: cytochrome b562 [Opitutales bacterium]